MGRRAIGIFVGSLRTESYCKKIARDLVGFMPEDFAPQMIDIGSLEMYNQDYDDTSVPPSSWVEFRKTVGKMDGFLFITPEYNRSFPAVLKNALDVGSRPYGKSVWDGKPGAIVSVSPGKMGAFGANHQLRQSMVFLNVYMMQQPEAYVGNVADLIGADGRIDAEGTESFLRSYIDAFAKWVDRF